MLSWFSTLLPSKDPSLRDSSLDSSVRFVAKDQGHRGPLFHLSVFSTPEGDVCCSVNPSCLFIFFLRENDGKPPGKHLSLPPDTFTCASRVGFDGLLLGAQSGTVFQISISSTLMIRTETLVHSATGGVTSVASFDSSVRAAGFSDGLVAIWRSEVAEMIMVGNESTVCNCIHFPNQDELWVGLSTGELLVVESTNLTVTRRAELSTAATVLNSLDETVYVLAGEELKTFSTKTKEFIRAYSGTSLTCGSALTCFEILGSLVLFGSLDGSFCLRDSQSDLRLVHQVNPASELYAAPITAATLHGEKEILVGDSAYIIRAVDHINNNN